MENVQQEISHLDLLSTPIGNLCSVVPLAPEVLWKSRPLPTESAIEDFGTNVAPPFEGKLNKNWKINLMRIKPSVEKMEFFEKIKTLIFLELVDFTFVLIRDVTITLHFKTVRILYDPGGQSLHELDG